MFSPTDVVVTVEQAKNLLIKAKNGINDAYATIEVLKEKYATGTEQSLTPRWHTECSFTLPPGGVLNKAVAIVAVHHKRHGKLGLESDEFLGHVLIPLSALNSSDNKKRSRWYNLLGKKKDSKKERGQIEVSFQFQSQHREIVPSEKRHSPATLKAFTSGLKSKLRRRSVDEDSGLGISEGDHFQVQSGTKGSSSDDVSIPRIIDPENTIFKRNIRSSSASSSPGVLHSARGSARLLQTNNLSTTKAMSVEVLHRPEIRMDSTSLERSNSGSGSHDSGNSSNAASPKINLRSSSLENVSTENTDSFKPRLRSPLNKNTSNSSRRHSTADIEKLKQQGATLATLYKPKNYYRLDVKDLSKVSTIHEDANSSYNNMSHAQLVQILNKQQDTLQQKNTHIRELEDYIDSLLVKVMIFTPQILDGSLSVCKTPNESKHSWL